MNNPVPQPIWMVIDSTDHSLRLLVRAHTEWVAKQRASKRFGSRSRQSDLIAQHVSEEDVRKLYAKSATGKARRTGWMAKLKKLLGRTGR